MVNIISHQGVTNKNYNEIPLTSIKIKLLRLRLTMGFPRSWAGKRTHLQYRSPGFDPWVRKIPCRPTHSIFLAWKILWREEPGGLQSRGLQWVRHDLATKPLRLTISYANEDFRTIEPVMHCWWQWKTVLLLGNSLTVS